MIHPKSILPALLASAILFLCSPDALRAAEDAGAKAPAAFAVEVTGSGRPMILIPGLSCGGNVWDDTVAHFKGEYQCHVVTLAGFAGQPSIGEPFLEKVRDALGQYIRDQKLDRPVIVGHSLGAFMALWLGATLPDQVGPIIAVDGVPFFPALQDPSATSQSMQPMAQMLKVGIASQNAVSNEEFLKGMITDPANLKKVVGRSNQSDPKAVGQAFYEIMTIDLRPKLKAIQVPVLLIGATAPITNPAEKKEAEENYRQQVATIPRHKVVFAPKARHFIQLDEPEFFYDQVGLFLKDSPGTAAP